jgi:hypothetical protein
VTVRVVVEGVPALQRALTDMGERMSQATAEAVNEVLRTAVQQQRTLLALGRHPPGTPTGSPPGSPPWWITGDLHDSVKLRRAKLTAPGTWFGEMGPTTIYSRIQELGGDTGWQHHTHLPPRPSLYPAWRIVRPTMRDTFTRHWAQAQRG